MDTVTGVVSTSSCGRNSTKQQGHEEGVHATREIAATPVIVKLRWHDFITCHSIASMNELYKHTKGVGHHWSVKKADESANYILGAVGEYAVAKYLGKFYDGNVGNLNAVDVAGEFEVKTTPVLGGHLIIKPEAKDSRPFVLAIVEDMTVRLPGWMTGTDIKNEKYKRADQYDRVTYWVPQSDLHPMSTLPRNTP